MPQSAQAWRNGEDFGKTITSLPATIVFNGAGIALSGTISQLCSRGHVRVYVDGVRTFDRTGLWQNHAMPDGDSVFFAWRWPTPGLHVIELEPAGAAQSGVPALKTASILSR